MLFDVNTDPTSLHVSIQIIIIKNEFKLHYAKQIQFGLLTVQLYQSGFSVSFDRVSISCPKSVFSTPLVDQMKKQPKFGILLQPPHFTQYLLMVFPF